MCESPRIVTFTTLGYGDYRPTDLSKILVSFEAILGIIVFGLIIVFFNKREELNIERMDKEDIVFRNMIGVEVEKQLTKMLDEAIKEKTKHGP